MSKRLFTQKGATRIFRQPVAWIEVIAIFCVMLAFAWFVGWSSYIDTHWIRPWLALLFIFISVWMMAYACVQKNSCQINSRKRTVVSSKTGFFFKTQKTQYFWDQFAGVRTLLIYTGDHQTCQVQLITKDSQSALSIANLPAVTKPGGRSLFAARKYENPIATQIRAELSLLMSLTDHGYVKDSYLKQLQ
jgi:hypothetical protein